MSIFRSLIRNSLRGASFLTQNRIAPDRQSKYEDGHRRTMIGRLLRKPSQATAGARIAPAAHVGNKVSGGDDLAGHSPPVLSLNRPFAN
jgi:hypothetical protein